MGEDYKTTVSKHNPEMDRKKLEEIRERTKENRMPEHLKKIIRERFG